MLTLRPVLWNRNANMSIQMRTVEESVVSSHFNIPSHYFPPTIPQQQKQCQALAEVQYEESYLSQISNSG